MAKTKKEKKEKKAGKRMKKKELVKALLDFFHVKQDEVLSLKYIFEQLHLTTHPLKMLCMDILSELSDDDYITEVDKHKYKLNNHGVEMTGTFQRKELIHTRRRRRPHLHCRTELGTRHGGR